MFGGWDEDWIAIETTDTGDESTTFEDAVRAGARALDSATKIVEVSGTREAGVIPFPVGEHECGIVDLTLEAEEHQSLFGN